MIEFVRTPILWLYVAGLIVVVVSVDLVFFRNLFWGRLLANIGLVLLFAAFYLKFTEHL